MKYQFQFAGADIGRGRSGGLRSKKRMRTGMMVGGVALLVLAYGYYLFAMTHHRAPAKPHAAAPVPIVTITTETIPAPRPETLPPVLQKAAESGALAIGVLITEATRFPEPPQQLTRAPQDSAAANPVNPGFKIVSAPVSPKVVRPLTTEEKMARAASAAMDRMLGMANKYPDAYGFLPEDDFTTVKLGEAIPVYSVTEEDRAAYRRGQSVKPLLKPASQWVYPVMAGDRICCMVQVYYNGRTYVPGDATKSLAMAWNKINSKWPAAEGYHPLLVVNAEIPGYFFTIPELPTPNLTDADQMFYMRPNLSPADVILASWR